MKKGIWSLLVMLILLCTACKTTGNNEKYTEQSPHTTMTTTDTTGEIPIGTGDTVQKTVFREKSVGRADAERLNVSKVLVCIVNEGAVSGVDPAIFSRFNELLVNEYNCDFVVEFKGYNFDADRVQAAEFLRKLREKGIQADVIYDGRTLLYEELVREGLFAPLTDFDGELFDKLYSAYPEKIWEQVMVDGKYYGVNWRRMPGRVNVVACNSEVAEEAGLDVGALKMSGYDIYKIGEILETLDKDKLAADNGGMYGIYAEEYGLFSELGCYCDYSEYPGIFMRKTADGKWKAFNFAEDEEFRRLFRQLKSYRDKGWLFVDSYAYEKADKIIEKGNFLFYIGSLTDEEFSNERIVLSGRLKSKVFDVVPVKVSGDYYGRIIANNMGVASWSEYGADAFKLLTLIKTDERLCNLLTYGIEGVHYKYENGVYQKLKCNDGTAMGDMQTVANLNLTLPRGAETENKTEFYKEIADIFEPSPLFEGNINLEEYEERLSEISRIYGAYIKVLITGNTEDADATMEALNAELKAAGIEEVVGAFNRYLEQQ